MVTLGNDWDEILKEEFEQEYYLKIRRCPEFFADAKNRHDFYLFYYLIFDLNSLNDSFYLQKKNGLRCDVRGQFLCLSN